MNGSIEIHALVLRRADWRDYDRMVTLFTPEYGRIEAVARGCRKPKSSLLNAAEVFTCGEFQLLQMNERFTIAQCRITENFYELRTDFTRLQHGVYWLKLLESILVEDAPAPNLFQMTLRALAYLSKSEIPAELLTAMFEMQLWRLAGFAPQMRACVNCGLTPEQTLLRFDAQKGGCVCEKCMLSAKPLSEGARRILMKAPNTPFDSVKLLEDRPEWPEAAKHIRDFTIARLGRALPNMPNL